MKQALWLILSWIPFWLGATETPRVINFSASAYQAQNQNWMVAQAPNGFMYFANSAGLLEYDGSRWTLYPLPDGQIVRSVACDAAGLIFTGGFAEFGYWKRNPEGRLSYHSLSEGVDAEKAGREEVWHILIAGESVYFQSFSIIYRFRGGQVQAILPPGNIMYLRQVGERLILPAIRQGLYELTAGGVFTFLEGSEFLAPMTVMDILPYGDGFMVCTNRNGMYLYQDGRFSGWENALNEQLKNFQLNKALKLGNGGLALGTILDGAYILDADGRLRFHLDKEGGLPDNTVLALCESRDGNLWLGLDRGISLAVLSEPLTYFRDKSGEVGTVYTATLHEGYLYIGANHGVFAKPWPSGRQQQFRLIDGTQGQAWELKVIDGQLLCGHNEGTFLIDGLQARKVSEVTGGWKTIRAPGHPELLLQGTYTGFIVLEKGAGGYWQFSRRLDGFGGPVRTMVWDDAGWLWAANPNRGLHRMQPDDALTEVSGIRSFGKGEGLPSGYGIEVQQLNGQVIARSGQQYYLWDESRQRFYRPGHFPGLPGSEEPYKLLEGGDGELFQAFAGRVVWYRQDSAVAELPLAMIPDNESVIPLNDSAYLFCIDDGYALLGRQALPLNPVHGKPLITRVEVLGQEKVMLAGLGAPLLVPPGRRAVVRFYYTFPQYTRTCRYRYRLSGFTDGWSDWEPTAFREFANLPPGNYRFEVQSSLSDVIAAFDLTVQAPWYRSRWVWVAYLLLAASAIAAWERLNQYRLARQRRSLELQRERELHQQRIQSRNEQLQSDIVNKSRELSNSTASLIRKNEILMQIKEELQVLRTQVTDKRQARHVNQLSKLIDGHITSEHDWEVLEANFNQVHEAFFKRLLEEYPELTPGDLRLAAYLKMNLSSKEIAPLLNISVRGVENKRYRLRKKMGLPADVNLTEVMMLY